mmetsp:Transcript_2957/g.8097  ORF Transcript_2957/g.8097 Transcript_2957/m.8097 type:complete len:264 (-) Transcript_2957:65-856(-)
MVWLSSAPTIASLVASASGLSFVVAIRDPMATASAPRASAAWSPLPLANPPAATSGVSGNSRASDGTSTSEVTSPPWAAASWPVTMSASAPPSPIAREACSRLVTVASSFPPYASRPSLIQRALPSETLMMGTSSSRATIAFSRAPGMSRVTPTPKGLGLLPASLLLLLLLLLLLARSSRVRRMDSRVSQAESGPVARIPTPPAFETAATSSGVEIQDIPGRTIGWSQPKRSVMRVERVFPFGGCGCLCRCRCRCGCRCCCRC